MYQWKPIFPSNAYKIPLHICFRRGNVGAKVDFKGQFKEVMMISRGFGSSSSRSVGRGLCFCC
jgi:hypothetical protein